MKRPSTRRAGVTEFKREFNIAADRIRLYLAEAGIVRSPVDKKWPYAEAAAAIRARKNASMTVGNRLAGRAGGKLHTVDLGPEEEVDPLDCTPSTPKAPAGRIKVRPGGPDQTSVPDALEQSIPDFAALREVKGELSREQVRKLRLANDVSEKRLIDRATVTDTLVRIVTNARTVLLTIGTRLAPTLAGESDPEAISTAIDNEIRRALTELATATESGAA